MGLGIDFGTSYTAAAFAADGRSRLIELDYDRTVAPTVLFVREDGGLIFGRDAELAGAARPDRILLNVKRDIGSQIPYRVGSVEVPVIEAIAATLRFVLDKAKTQVPEFGLETMTTLTVPATFSDSGFRVEALKEAASVAGFNPKTTLIISEPVAASIGFQSGDWPRPTLNSQAVLLVYDLGGGTFDAAAVRLSASGDAVIGLPVGDETIGGYSFDRAILDEILKASTEQVQTLYHRPKSQSELNAWRGRITTALRLCRDVKERLPFIEQAHIQLPDVPPPPLLFTATNLNSIVSPFIETTASLLERLASEINESGLSVEGVLLVGGSCRLPIVSSVLKQRLGLPLLAAPDPARIVAVGAAIDAMRRAQKLKRTRNDRRVAGERSDPFEGFLTRDND